MIHPDRVGLANFQKVEGSLRNAMKRISQYNWYAAGHHSGSSPSPWAMVEYGREHSLAWFLEGEDLSECVYRGIRAMYYYAYGETRGTVRWVQDEGGHRSVMATSFPSVSASSTGHHYDSDSELLLLDRIARSYDLSDLQKQLVTLYSFGWSVSDAADQVGLPRRTGYRRFNEALEILREEWEYGT